MMLHHLSDPPFDMLLSDFLDTRNDWVLSRRKLRFSALPGEVCGEPLEPLLFSALPYTFSL